MLEMSRMSKIKINTSKKTKMERLKEMFLLKLKLLFKLSQLPLKNKLLMSTIRAKELILPTKFKPKTPKEVMSMLNGSKRKN